MSNRKIHGYDGDHSRFSPYNRGNSEQSSSACPVVQPRECYHEFRDGQAYYRWTPVPLNQVFLNNHKQCVVQVRKTIDAATLLYNQRLDILQRAAAASEQQSPLRQGVSYSGILKNQPANEPSISDLTPLCTSSSHSNIAVSPTAINMIPVPVNTQSVPLVITAGAPQSNVMTQEIINPAPAMAQTSNIETEQNSIDVTHASIDQTEQKAESAEPNTGSADRELLLALLKQAEDLNRAIATVSAGISKEN